MFFTYTTPSLVPANDPGQDGTPGSDVPADVFGMALDYYNRDYRRTNTPTPVAQQNPTGTDQYNGNIKSMRFRTQGLSSPVGFNTYNYSYNKNNWLKGAVFGEGGIAPTGGGKFQVDFAPDLQNDYRVSGIAYDPNGNILELKRNGHTDAYGDNSMDDFHYSYYPGTNRLKNVYDSGDNSDPQRYNDLRDQKGRNYEYNVRGQLVLNRQDSLTYSYYRSGLVREIQKSGVPLVKFFYNDRGQRARKESFGQNGSLATTTYYVRDAAGSAMAVYEKQSQEEPKLAEHPVYGLSRLGVFYRGPGITFYQLTDHLGNVRAVVVKAGGSAVSVTQKTDYYPFGMPMPGRNVDGGYRYAYQGQEKDDETGMEAFELRLWDGRIGRWLSPDPMGIHHSPYQGMANNPIIVIDLNGGYPTPLEAALMAAFVYGDPNITLIGGWILSKITNFNKNDPQSGLKASLFERKLKDGRIEYAYVYAGSSMDWKDWKNNFQQIYGSSGQYATALIISTDLSVYLKQKELTFIGHSLGGGLANYSSLATGRLSVTFDPAWISKASIKKINTIIPLEYRPAVQQTNYIPRGASLHQIQKSTIASAFVKPTGENVLIGNFLDNFRLNTLEVHDINNIIRDIFFTFGRGKDNKSGCGCR